MLIGSAIVGGMFLGATIDILADLWREIMRMAHV
jgi:hypothetical protein